MNKRSGFTLTELLVVMALTAILLTIIFVPVIQGFNLTKAAQAFASAQDLARSLIRKIEREVGNGAGIRDNTGLLGAISVVTPGRNSVPAVATTLTYMKLDILQPAQGDPSDRENLNGTPGAFRDPDSGKYDPTIRAPKGQVNLPSTSGMGMVRYFVGLRAPLQFDGAGDPAGPGLYNNPYDGLLMSKGGKQDNLYVLYRAQVQTKVWDRNAGRYVVNTALFQDANNDGVPDDIDDPAFFAFLPGVDAIYTPQGGTFTAAGRQKAARVANWLTQSVIVTEVSRYDMIAPVYNKANRVVEYIGDNPVLVPMVRFQPVRVSSEPAAGQSAVRSGEEGSNMSKAGPDQYRTQYGLWSSLLMRLWPSSWPQNFSRNGDRAGDVRKRWDQGGAGQPYVVGRGWNDNTGAPHFSMFMFDPQTMSDDTREGLELFDASVCDQIRRLPVPDYNNGGGLYPYAFSQAVNQANGRSGWLANGVARETFVPFMPDSRNGNVYTSFDVREVGSDESVPYHYRVPTWGQQGNGNLFPDLKYGVRVSPYDANNALDYTPNNDPGVNTGNWFDAVFEPVNRRFNKLWVDFPTLAPGLDRAQYVKRFIDLRVSNQADGTPGPLNPLNNLARLYISPGSEVVTGPDQRPGPNYGRYIRYTRAAQRPVGPNQYFINYVDQPEPDWQSLGLNLGGIIGNVYDPRSYSPQNLIQAILQPQYRAGYVELNSKFGEPIPSGYTDGSGFHPTGNIFVTYRFQTTEPNDVVAVDYDSTQVMEVNLTVRNYPQVNNIPNPQTVTVKGAAEVRNFVR